MVQELIDCGFVDFVDFKNNLYYLEFVYVNELRYETQYRIGTFICDIKGNIYKATMMGYAFCDNKIIQTFPQIISKTDNINISDIFKKRQDSGFYLKVVGLRDVKNAEKGSKVWSSFVKGNNNSVDTIVITINNVSNKDYFVESKEEFRLSEYFRNEHGKFKLLADKIENGLLNTAQAVYCGLHNLGIAVESAHGIGHMEY